MGRFGISTHASRIIWLGASSAKPIRPTPMGAHLKGVLFLLYWNILVFAFIFPSRGSFFKLFLLLWNSSVFAFIFPSRRRLFNKIKQKTCIKENNYQAIYYYI